jgi:hypothetical protein
MNSSLENELREKLINYLSGEISLKEFENWFVPASWNVNRSNNQAAINIVYEIELWLSEYSDGFRSEGELRNLLLPLVKNYHVNIEVSHKLKLGSNGLVECWSMSPVPSHKLSSAASL